MIVSGHVETDARMIPFYTTAKKAHLDVFDGLLEVLVQAVLHLRLVQVVAVCLDMKEGDQCGLPQTSAQIYQQALSHAPGSLV